NSFSLTSSAGKVTGQLTVNGDRLTFVPSTSLQGQRTYTINISAVAEDLAGNAMVSDFSSTFTTLDNVVPVLANTVPVHMAYNVPVNTTVQLIFSEAIADLGTYTITRSSGQPAVVSNVTWNSSRTVATLKFNQAFANNERVTVSLTGFSDGSGNVQTNTSVI